MSGILYGERNGPGPPSLASAARRAEMPAEDLEDRLDSVEKDGFLEVERK